MEFENIRFWEEDGVILVACRDRMVHYEERWVVAALTKEEIRQLCGFLKEKML